VETVEELKETVKGHLRKMPHIRNTLVLVAIEPRGSYTEEASFWIGIAVVNYSVYPNGTTMVYVACSNNPFKLEDEADEISLYSFLVFTLS